MRCEFFFHKPILDVRHGGSVLRRTGCWTLNTRGWMFPTVGAPRPSHFRGAQATRLLISATRLLISATRRNNLVHISAFPLLHFSITPSLHLSNSPLLPHLAASVTVSTRCPAPLGRITPTEKSTFVPLRARPRSPSISFTDEISYLPTR